MIGQSKEHTSSSSTTCIFISHSMENGGVESLVVRMSNQLAKAGYAVHVIAPVGPMSNLLDPRVQQHVISGEIELDRRLSSLRNLGRNVNVWFSLPGAIVRHYWVLRRFSRRKGLNVRVVSGIFHPNQIRRTPTLSKLFLKTVLLRYILPLGSVYFMNEACKAAHRFKWGGMFEAYPVRKFSLNGEVDSLWRVKSRYKLSIVSVGRIVPFKSYNYEAPQVVKGLSEKGIDVEWHIFGEGADLGLLKLHAAGCGVDARLKYLGSLPYGEMRAVIANFDIFVGMGTAALEAAEIGMPTILCVESSGSDCYGFLCQAPSDIIGEVVAGARVMSLSDALVEYHHLTIQERASLGDQCRLAVALRSSGEGPPFDAIFANGLKFPNSNSFVRSAALLGVSLILRLGRRGSSSVVK